MTDAERLRNVEILLASLAADLARLVVAVGEQNRLLRELAAPSDGELMNVLNDIREAIGALMEHLGGEPSLPIEPTQPPHGFGACAGQAPGSASRSTRR